MADRDYSYQTIGDGVKSVTTAGTAVQLSSSSIPCRMVEVQARAGNTGKIAVGASTVVATAGSERGIILQPGQSASFRVKDVSTLYLDASVSGEGVSYVYFNN